MASKEDVKDAIREVLHERLVPVVNNEDPRFADPAGKVSVIRAIQGTWRNARGVYMRVNK